jgi:putative salt-induced outer membrane protein YdiY
VRYFTGRNPLIEGRLAGSAALVWRGQRHQQHDAQELLQNLSVEAGDESNITRSETSIQSDIMNNLSMKFAIKVKNQSEVPIGREKTDTEASVTTLLRL